MSENEKKSIIIADDNELNREMLCEILSVDYKIYEAKDGQEVIDIISENKDNIKLLFLDLIMPNKTGMDVLNWMNDNETINTIPVVMITGAGTSDTDMQAYELGVSDIIYKPFTTHVVRKRAKNLVELFELRNYL